MASFNLVRTPMYDPNGNMNRAWVLYFSQGTQGAQAGYSLLTVNAGTAVPDLSSGTMLEVVLTSATQIAAPTNGSAGTKFTLLLQQDPTGGWPVTFDPAYKNVDPSGFDTTLSTFITMEFSTRDGATWYKTAGPSAAIPL